MFSHKTSGPTKEIAAADHLGLVLGFPRRLSGDATATANGHETAGFLDLQYIIFHMFFKIICELDEINSLPMIWYFDLLSRYVETFLVSEWANQSPCIGDVLTNHAWILWNGEPIWPILSISGPRFWPFTWGNDSVFVPSAKPHQGAPRCDHGFLSESRTAKLMVSSIFDTKIGWFLAFSHPSGCHKAPTE